MDSDPSMLSTEELLAQSGWLHSLARRLVGDPAAADDLVQDTLVSALRRPPSTDRPLRPWLAKVARNLVRSRARSDGTRKLREVAHHAGGETPSAAELSEKLESQHLLVAAIRELAEPYRSTILLHYFEQLTAEEIARRQGIPAGTVRWRLKRAVDSLRERLDKRTDGDRRAWIALLVPLTRENTASAASIATGVLGMNLLWKASAAAAIAAALATSWWIAAEPASTQIVVPTKHEVVTFEPLESVQPAVGLVESNESQRESIVAVPNASVSKQAANAMRFEARILDENLRPIAGATLRVQYVDVVVDAVSNQRGEVVLALAAQGLLFFTARAAGYATVSRDETVTGSGTLYLGDLVLAPGGAVAGRIQDRDGAPIAGARVSLDDLHVEQSELARRFMPFIDPHKEPSTTTRSDGTFVLDGVPAGFARLLASDKAHLPGFTGVIEVHASEVSRGVELALDPISADRRLHGVVLNPDGIGVSGAHVQYRAARFSGTFVTNRQGRFETLCPPNESFELIAEDQKQRWASVWLKDVRPNSAEIVMKFEPARACTLVVLDPSDRPISTYRAAVWSSDLSRRLQESSSNGHPDGRVPIAVPSVDFVILVDDLLHLVGTIGPISPASIPKELSIRLEAAPQIVGSVRSANGPIAGALVRLFEDQCQRTVFNGFPVFVEPDAIAETRSGPDGSFRLAVRGVAPFHVRAESEGLAPRMIGPLELDRGSVDLELTPGGAIEGRVRTAAGQSPAGVIVGFSRGDACGFTRRVGPDGNYRVEELAPGRWMVQRVEREIFEHSAAKVTRPGRWEDIPSNCEVVDGRTTYFDLDLGAPDTAPVLTGELRVDSGAPGVWRARLVAPDTRSSTADVLVDVVGRFRAAAGADGEYRLFLTCLSGPLEGTRLGAKVSLRGEEMRWSLDLPTAELELDGRGSELTPGEHLVYSVDDVPGLFLAIRPLPPGEDPATVTVPAGKGAIVRFDDATGQRGDPIARFNLRPGESARFKRP